MSHRLVWTQSVTRTRWLATKLATVGPTSVMTFGLLSLVFPRWAAPIDASRRPEQSGGSRCIELT